MARPHRCAKRCGQECGAAAPLFAASLEERFNSESFREQSASTSNELRTARQRDPESVRGFQLPKLRRRVSAFTLLELLIVLGIVAVMLAALLPAVTSLSKAGGRRAARDSLLGGIERARAEAITSGQATYVVFPTFTSGTQSTLDRYNYRSYAIFEDNAASPGNVKQLTDWKSFPTGVALRATGTAALSNLPAPATLTPAVTFSFTPDTSAAPFRCMKFNSNGQVNAGCERSPCCV